MTLSLSKSYSPSSGQTANSTSYNTDIAALFNAFSGLEAQTASLGGLTITPSANSTTTLSITNAAGTQLIGVDTTGSKLILKATGLLCFDGGNDTYVAEVASNDLRFTVGGALNFRMLATSAEFSQDVFVAATKKLYIDGGSDTYIYENAANSMQFITNSGVSLALSSGNHVLVSAGKQLHLDGDATGDTYIIEASANKMHFYAGSVLTFKMEDVCIAPTGIRIGTDAATYLLDDASSGSGTATLYIGNAAITVSSDRRIKKDIEDTRVNATEMISKMKVKDFLWDDPTDKAINNRNSRGVWTGLIAQEVVDICPFIVNAPRPEGKEINYESDLRWGIEYGNFVPILIKAIQELTERVNILEGR